MKFKASTLQRTDLSFAEAMQLAKEFNRRVRCDGYMAPGWKIGWFPEVKGFYNINPHTGSEYLFTPQKIDHDSKWRVVA